MLGGQTDASQKQVHPVQKPEKPIRLEDREPNMTFSGIGRNIDIRAWYHGTGGSAFSEAKGTQWQL